MAKADLGVSLKMQFIRGEITFEQYRAMLSGTYSLRDRLRQNLSALVLLLVIAVVVGYVLSRLRIVVLIPVPWWGALLFVLGTIVVLFLVLDHFVNPG